MARSEWAAEVVRVLEDAGALQPRDRARALGALAGLGAPPPADAAPPAPPPPAAPAARPEAPLAPGSFAADVEFLRDAMGQHVGGYYRRVLGPAALVHHNGGGRGIGRLLTDQEVNAASETLTLAIFQELGGPYRARLERYFGDDEHLIAYIMTRVRDLLTERAIDHNDAFLQARRGAARAAELAAPRREEAP
jgi:hypothetical protein